jgi:hypothetical protein
VLRTLHTSTADAYIDIDRTYDLHVLAAIGPTLGLFDRRALEVQLGAMAKQRRAICFTVMSPVRKHAAGDGPLKRGIATVLVCLHVAPELARRGVDALLDIMAGTVEAEAEPVHEIVVPISNATRLDAGGAYREAVYADGPVAVAVTTHTSVELPAETLAAVAAATQGAAVDIVTTVAITLRHLQAAPQRAARRTLH